MAECLQFQYGPTPCFRDAEMVDHDLAQGLPCGLKSCPVVEYLIANPEVDGWKALHSQCVVTHPYDYKGELAPIQLAIIANKKKSVK